MFARTYGIVVFVLLSPFNFLVALDTPKTPISKMNPSNQKNIPTPLSSISSAENQYPYITDALGFASAVLKDMDKLVKSVSKKADGQAADTSLKPMDCAEIYMTQKIRVDGLYKIWPRSRVLKKSIWAYCDMESDGGGWTLIQRRGDFDSPSDYFYKTWESYKTGFGDLMKDFWIGNDIIYALTNQRASSIKFVLTDFEGNTTYADFDKFWIDDEDHKYTLHVEGYRGTAGDSLMSVNNAPFTTKDRDNDKSDQNCAEQFKGAWWYVACHESNLNGYYLRGKHESFADGMEWKSFRGYHYSLKDTFMKIRPSDFAEQIREMSV